MPPRQFVTLAGRAVDLGIEAGSVLEVLLRDDWREETPLDLAATLQWDEAPAEDAGARRVLLVRSRRGDVPVRANGKVSLCTADAAGVLGLPPEVLRGNSALALAGLVLGEGRRPVVVLAPEGLWRLFESEEGRTR